AGAACGRGWQGLRAGSWRRRGRMRMPAAPFAQAVHEGNEVLPLGGEAVLDARGGLAVLLPPDDPGGGELLQALAEADRVDGEAALDVVEAARAAVAQQPHKRHGV